MTAIRTTAVRPEIDEHIPYFGQYIALVPEGDVIEILSKQISDTSELFLALTPDQARSRPAPGEWSALEIAGHLIDTERVLAYRALRIARADPTLWESIDFEHYVEQADFDVREMSDLIDEFGAVRQASVAFLRGLGHSAWDRRMPDEWSCRTVKSLAYVIAGHELHHVASLGAVSD